MNRVVNDNVDRCIFVSALYAAVDQVRRALVFGRTGQCRFLLCRGGRRGGHLLEPRGIGLGLEAWPLFDCTVREQILQLCTDDIVLLSTDGLVDGRIQQGQEFEDGTLAETLAEPVRLLGGWLGSALVEAVAGFMGAETRYDDLTLVILKTC